MTWPIYPDLTDRPEIVRHTGRQQAGATRGAPPRYASAVDVWRDGVHMWRSYTPDTGESVDAYAARVLGPDYPTDHDNGVWRVPGVEHIADWPVPTHAALSEPMSLQAIHDMLTTLIAIGLLPDRLDADIDAAPSIGTMSQRMVRAGHGWNVFTVQVESVSIRCMVARTDVDSGTPADASPSAAPRQWRVTLQRREVRAGVPDVDMGERVATFVAPSGTPVHGLVQHAKAAIGLTGWPMQRRDKATATWHLARAPYIMTIEECAP